MEKTLMSDALDSLNSRALSVRDTVRGKNLFVTGTSGFLGKVWLVMLLDLAPQVGRISLLLRGKKGENAEARFLRMALTSPAFRPLRDKHGSALPSFLSDHVNVVAGDVSQPNCGLSASDLASLGEVDVTLHFAGLTDFEPDPTQALRTNIDGTAYAADVAAQTRGKRFLHVSTCFVAGNLPNGAPTDVPESLAVGRSPNGKPFSAADEIDALRALCAELPTKAARVAAANARAHALGWPNLYTYSKGLGERALAARTDIVHTTARPAVVESARAYPFTGWNEGINTSGPLVWLLSSWFRRFPTRPANHFDVIPVDTVARDLMVITALLLRNESEEVYQLGTSDVNAFTFERAVDLTALSARRKHGRGEASPLQRLVLRHLDAVPQPGEADAFPSMKGLRKFTQNAQDLVKKFDAGKWLPAALHAEVGDAVEERRRTLSNALRTVERVFGRVDDMLRLYRPFTHDNDYVFITANVRRAAARLVPNETTIFGHDVDTIDWRHYWLDVHVPGLERWSLPLIYGERVADDPMPAWAQTEAGVEPSKHQENSRETRIES